MDAILPAAGLATRMRGIPKFLLPADTKYTALIEHHIRAMTDIVRTIWIPTRPELVPLLDSLGFAQERIVIVPVTTGTMNHTIQRVLEISSADEFILTMPDTRFLGETPYTPLSTLEMSTLARVACWPIRSSQRGKLGQVRIGDNDLIQEFRDKDSNCTFELAWGAVSFRRTLRSYIHPADPHIGYALKQAVDDGAAVKAITVNGQYFDCGTPEEYVEMLNASEDPT